METSCRSLLVFPMAGAKHKGPTSALALASVSELLAPSAPHAVTTANIGV